MIGASPSLLLFIHNNKNNTNTPAFRFRLYCHGRFFRFVCSCEVHQGWEILHHISLTERNYWWNDFQITKRILCTAILGCIGDWRQQTFSSHSWKTQRELKYHRNVFFLNHLQLCRSANTIFGFRTGWSLIIFSIGCGWERSESKYERWEWRILYWKGHSLVGFL